MTAPATSDDEVALGVLTIVGPTASEARCSLMHDLATLFGDATNTDALARLRARWRADGRRGRLDLDCEADHVFVYAGRDAIVDAAVVIHELAGRPLDPAAVAGARAALRALKRPPRVRWAVGDVFAVPLPDGTFAFGQVLFEQDFAPGSGVRAPTCVLLEHRAATLVGVDLEEVLTSRSLAILHELSTELDAGRWSIVGRASPIGDPAAGRHGAPGASGSISGSSLEPLALAWWGLAPWNVLARADYYDQLLLPGVGRPAQARVLGPSARAAYRFDHFGVTDPDPT